MSSWTDNQSATGRSARSRSPRRDGGFSGDHNRDRDLYGRDAGQGGWGRDRRGRSRSPEYDDARKRRRSMSPYDRERYESRPRYDDHDSYRGFDRSPPRSRDHRHGHGAGSRSYRAAPPDPHTFDAPASLKQYAEWFRHYYPEKAADEDKADKLAEQDAGDGSRPRNGIKSRWERYKKDFLQKQLQILFEHHRKSPWFAEKYDPELADLRLRVRKVGWRGRMNQFVIDLENGKFDVPSSDDADAHELNANSNDAPTALESGEDVFDTSIRNDDEFGMGPEGEEDNAGHAGDSKVDTNGSGPKGNKNEVSVMPEGNQVMIRTIPPDIGRVKLEAALRELSGFVYLALGDPMQKRNYYRAGWIKFDIATDVQNHIEVLSERKIEGFKLQVTHNSEAFTGKTRSTPEAASRPERIAKDLSNAKKLASLLEDEYEQVRMFRQTPKPKADSGDDNEANGTAAHDETANGDAPLGDDVLTVDAMTEDEPPSELGSHVIEKKLATMALEFPEPENDEAVKALEVKKNTIALDLYVAYLRSAFHTCYYCVAVCDHIEELQRKCIKHIRKPRSESVLGEGEKDGRSKDDDDTAMQAEAGDEQVPERKQSDSKNRGKDKDAKSELRKNAERWAESLDAKIALLIHRDQIDYREYGGKRYEEALTKAVEPHVKQEDEGKFRCKSCNKLFRATAFVEKHIANKHPEHTKHLDELPYFNNFALDPQRISPLSHYPGQVGNGQPVPPQAYGLQNMPSVPQPPIDLGRNGMNIGLGIGPGGAPVAFYPLPGQFPPHFANGGNPYVAYYPQTAVPQQLPMRSLRDEPPLATGNGRRLGDRIGGYMQGGEGPGSLPSHGIEGLPAKPVSVMDTTPGSGSGGGGGGSGRRGAGRTMPPPPPDAKEDPRAAAGRKVSYHDMDLVAEGDVELSY